MYIYIYWASLAADSKESTCIITFKEYMFITEYIFFTQGWIYVWKEPSIFSY